MIRQPGAIVTMIPEGEGRAVRAIVSGNGVSMPPLINPPPVE